MKTLTYKLFSVAKTRDAHNDGESDGEILELGPIGIASTSQSRPSASSSSSKVDGGIQFTNAPYLTWIYTDHVKRFDFVCVAVTMISGSRDITFTLSDDGMKLYINFVWPMAMYSAEELFKEYLVGPNAIQMDHPKVHSYSSRLVECGLMKNSRPSGTIAIQLPMKVMREVGSFSIKTVQSVDETRIAMLEFQAYQKKQYIDDANTSITFK